MTLIFSCPPYADLGSIQMIQRPFDFALQKIFEGIPGNHSLMRVNAEPVPCFVVGDVRNKGFYELSRWNNGGLSGLRDDALQRCRSYNGCRGHYSIRVGRAFGGYRKLGKTHQNVLVFIRADLDS